MDKQQSDHIEHHIRQAAENFDPPFNEAAWKKMEVMLDKDNKGRRRGFIWWWYGLFVCLIIGAGIIFYQNSGSGTNITADENKDLDTQIGSRQDKNKEGIINKNQPKLQVQEKAPLTNSPREHKDLITGEQRDKKTISADPLKNLVTGEGKPAIQPNRNVKRLNREQISHKTSGNKDNTKTKSKNKDQIVVDESGLGKADDKTPEIERTNSQRPQTLPSREDQLTSKDKRSDTLKDTGQVSKIPPQTNIAADSSLNKPGNPKKSIKLTTANDIAKPGFYFIGSIAADASSVKTFVLSDRKPVYGIGIGYRLNNRISIQTGFYAGRKIYKARSEDYKVNPNTYLGRLKILSVDADCLIYELPLQLRYDILAAKKFRVYATAGLSSFIMKRETYNYHVTGTSGYYQKDSTYRGNKNFFSSAGFSIGFEQKLSNSFYIQAEPYLRLPISGVGEGKVKLYSAGLQAGIKYQPIKKNKK